MFTEQEFLIHVYCLVCQYYHRLFPGGVRRAGYGPQLTDTEAITIAIVDEYLDLDTDKAIYEYFEHHYQGWFPDLPCRTALVRQWANLWIVTQKSGKR